MEGGIPASPCRVQKLPWVTSAIGFIGLIVFSLRGTVRSYCTGWPLIKQFKGRKVWIAKVWQVTARRSLQVQEAETGKVMMLKVAALAGLGGGASCTTTSPFPPATIQFPSLLFSLVLAHLEISVNSISCWSACLWCALVCWIIMNCSWWLPLSSIHSLIWVLQLPCFWLFRPPFSPPLAVYSKCCCSMPLSQPFPSHPGFPGLHTGKLSYREQRAFCCPLAACCHRSLSTCQYLHWP